MNQCLESSRQTSRPRTTSVRRYSRAAVFLAVGLAMTLAVSDCRADFVWDALGPAVKKDNPFMFEFTVDWTFTNTYGEPGHEADPAAAERPTNVARNIFGTDNWVTILESTAADENFKRDLTLKWVHFTPPPGPPHAGEGPNPAQSKPDFPETYYSLTLEGMQRPAAGFVGQAKVSQKSHGPHKHFDVVRLQAYLPPVAAGNGKILAKGEHVGGKLATWSYHALTAGEIQVKSGGKRVSRTAVSPADPRNPYGGDLPEGATDYQVIFAGQGASLPVDPITDTTLAFLGEVDGSPGQLDLAAAIQLFGGSEFVQAPMFLDVAQERDLYVAVDLTQWLSFPTPYVLGDAYSFVDGGSELFPGIQISTSPFTYDSAMGFQSDGLATGEFEIVGTVDGDYVPEPTTLFLLSVCLVALSGRRSVRSSRRLEARSLFVR